MYSNLIGKSAGDKAPSYGKQHIKVTQQLNSKYAAHHV